MILLSRPIAVPESIRKALQTAFPVAQRKSDERLEAQGLPSVAQMSIEEISSLKPRFDWREKFRRHKKHAG